VLIELELRIDKLFVMHAGACTSELRGIIAAHMKDMLTRYIDILDNQMLSPDPEETP